ncbi:MAG: glycosyltransferase [Pedobacter sp.]
MEVIVNLLPIVTGGGLQNALSFLSSFADNSNGGEFVFLVRKDTDIHIQCQSRGLATIPVGNCNKERFKFEMSAKSRFRKGQVCFTLFGPVMLGTSGHLINVVGCAYSNLFYPEIPFWSYLPFFVRMKKEAIDLYRRHQLSKGDFWIFETEALKKRAIELCHFPYERVGVVQMAVSTLVSRSNANPETMRGLSKKCGERFKFLFLSGAHPNKRLHLLPSIGSQMLQMGHENFTFITTFEENTPYAMFVLSEIEKHGLSNHFVNVGKVSPSDVSSLIASIDCICTFSLLESFSNNFVEAWKMEVPLIVTDGDWSRLSCGEGALYVRPDSPKECAETLIAISSDKLLASSQVLKGSLQLDTYLDAGMKLRLYLEYIAKAAEIGCCPKENKKIKWF